jgi:WD40 repeat protein
VFENNDGESGFDNALGFGFNICPSSLRSISISSSGKYLACAGIDEKVRLFDLTCNKSYGEVSNQVGAINSLKFYKDSFLFSGSEVFFSIAFRHFQYKFARLAFRMELFRCGGFMIGVVCIF